MSDKRPVHHSRSDRQVVRDRQVSGAMQKFDKRISEVRGVVDILADQLGNVLRPSEPTTDTPDGGIETAPRQHAPMAEHLNSMEHALGTTVSTLKSILDRLEL